MPRPRHLRDGTVLKLHKYENGQKQLQLKDGVITLQFPTTESIEDEYLLEKFYRIKGREDFEKMVNTYRGRRQIFI